MASEHPSASLTEMARDAVRGIESSGHTAITWALLAQVQATDAQTDAIRELTATVADLFAIPDDKDAPIPAIGHPRGQLRVVDAADKATDLTLRDRIFAVLTHADCNCEPGDPTCQDWADRVARLTRLSDAVADGI